VGVGGRNTVKKKIIEIVSDGLALVGAAIIGVGVYMIYPPATVVYGGAVALLLGFGIQQRVREKK